MNEMSDVARALVGLNYRSLTEVARALVEMNENGERDVKTVVGMAETLFDWAEAVVGEEDSNE